jgi:hypothetical protein
MFKKSIALVVSTSMLSACYGFGGPQPVLSASGVVAQDHEGQPRDGIFFQRFSRLALRAAGCSEGAPFACSEDSGESAVDAALLRRYMRAGFALIYADCDQYMATMARHQGRSGVARDLIGPITNLITGILSLRNLSDGDEQEWLTRLTLGSSATSAALDIIDQRFLFGSDNIDAVRERVTASLGAQADTALARPDADLNFERASSEILNNQALCTPSGILRLTRNAIQNAPATANNSTSGSKPGTPAIPAETSGTSATSVDS